MFKKITTKLSLFFLMLITVSFCLFAVTPQKVEAAGHYEYGAYQRSFKEKIDYARLKNKIRRKNYDAKAAENKVQYERIQKIENSITNIINFSKQKDKNWSAATFNTSKLAVNIIANCIFPGSGVVTDGVFNIVDALLPGASPLSETAVLQNKMEEEFGKISAQLTDIENEIAKFPNTINAESNRVISEVSSQLDALDARQYVRTFTFSGEGNFSYNQFSNYLYGSTSPENVNYSQAYYNSLLEAIINNESDSVIKEKYDNLYNALMSTSANGQSNYVMLYEYLTGEKSVSQYYYDYLLSNQQLFNDSESAEEIALDYAKEKYFTAISAGSIIQTCNAYQLNYMMEEYGDALDGNSKYFFNKNTGEYITYNQLIQNVAYITNNREALMKSLIKDIAYITNMGDSYLFQESNGNIYTVTNANETTYGQVVTGQKVFINQIYEELVCDIAGCQPDDFHYFINNIEVSPQITVGGSDFSVVAFYKDVRLFEIDFHVGSNGVFNGGDGSEEYPYNISNATQLNMISNDLSANYRLIADIDCNEVIVNSIGNSKEHFSGVFDGNGHIIKNLTIVSTVPNDFTKPLYTGLFSYVENGTIKNLTLKNADVKSQYENDGIQENGSNTYFYSGILVGCNEGTIDNCVIQDSSLKVNRHNEVLNRIITVYVGGFAGSNFGTIKNCSAEGVKIDAKSYHSYQAESDSGNKNSIYVGGIAGQSLGYIKNCRVDKNTELKAFAESYCNAKMTTKYPYINVYAGGIAAIIKDKNYIQDVYSAAKILDCSYSFDNTAWQLSELFGVGGESGKNCKKEPGGYVPGQSIEGLNDFNNVILPENITHIAEVTCSETIKNGSMYLDSNILTIKVDGMTIDNYNIIGVYGFDSKNTNVIATSQNNVTVVFACEINGKALILSDSLSLTIEKNRIVGINVNNLVKQYKYGDVVSSDKPAYITIKYSAGNSNLVEASNYNIGFFDDQTSLKYGDNRVWLSYQGVDVEFVINIECLHNFAYEVIEATCGHFGYTYRRCTLCGEEEIISYTPKLTRHSLITIEEAQAATCEHEGSTGKVYCLECGYVLVEESIIPKTAHTYVYSNATEHICSACNHAEAHQYTVSESINEKGNLVFTYKCHDCGYSYSETDTNTITTLANTLPTLAVSDGFALNGGDLVAVYVELLNNPGITGANFGIRYDERLTLVDWDEGTILPNTVSENNPVNCGWNYLWGAADATFESGNVLTLVFRVPYDAKSTDKYSVNVVYGLIKSTDGGFSLDDGTTMPKKFITRAGTISMVDHLPGDANDDDIVDLMDAVYTARYLIDKIEEINNSYADVNLDGQVNLYDVIHTLRGLIGGYGTNFLNQQYEIVLNANGADIQYDNLVVSLYGDNNFYLLPIPARPGYTFLGWNTRIYGDGGQFIQDGESVRYDNKQLTQTLYARWIPNSVSFDVNGATTGSIDSVTYSTSNTSVVLPLPQKQYTVNVYYGDEYLEPKTFSFPFQYWLDETTGEFYHAGETYQLDTINGGAVTLKAKWGIISVTGEIKSNRIGYEFGGYYYVNPQVVNIINGDSVLDSEEAIRLDTWLQTSIPETRELGIFFTPVTRSITLNSNGGTCSESELSVTYDQTYSKLPVPTRTGYDFDGWYVGNIKIADIDGSIRDVDGYFKHGKSVILNDLTAVAHWKVKTYAVNFDKNTSDSINGDLSAINVEFDAVYGSHKNLPTLTRTGYNFDGWFTASAGGTQVTEATIVSVAENHTLYAHWVAKNYIVTFDAVTNGGECSITSKKATFDASYGELPVASKVGYDFVGWFTTSKNNGVEITAETIVKLTQNQTVYARFSNNAYKVTFEPNDGICGTIEKHVVYDDIYGILPTPTRIGYDFDGWYTDIVNGEKVIASTVVSIANNHALYAHWTKHVYTITLNNNSDYNGVADPVTGAISSFTVRYGDTLSNLPENPARKGYTFNGWFTAPTGGTRVTKNSTFQLTTDITYYAQWTVKQIKITFSGLEKTVTVNYRDTFSGKGYEKVGYTFAGWFTEANGIGTQIFDGGNQIVYGTDYVNEFGKWIYVDDSNNSTLVTLYPKWDNISYTVKYDSNKPATASSNVSGTMADSSFKYDTSSNLRSNTYTLNGWTFAGWATSSGGSVEYTDKQSVKNLANTKTTVILYAVWEKNTYTVVYNKNKPTNAISTVSVDGAMSNSTYSYDVLDYLETNQYKLAGWEFKGWAITTNGSVIYNDAGSIKNLATGTSNDKTVNLYAVWEAKNYTIIYNLNKPTNAKVHKTNGVQGGATSTSQTYISGKSNTVLANPYTVEGWIFKGWSISNNGNVYYSTSAKTDDVSIQKGTSVVGRFKDTVTLYAVWELDPWTVGQNVENGKTVKGTQSGSTEYKAYNSISGMPSNTPAGNTIIDLSKETNYTIGKTLNVTKSSTSVIFVGISNKKFENFNIDICNFANGQSLVLKFKNFSFVTNSSTAIGINNNIGINLTVEVYGNCSIESSYNGVDIGGSIIGKTDRVINNLTLKGSGKLSVAGGNGADATTASGNGADGGTAIYANNVIVNISGGLIVTGGDGGNGADGAEGIKGANSYNANNDHYRPKNGTDGGNGGDGGNGAAPIVCKQLTNNSNISIYLNSGKGGNGGKGGAGGAGGNDVVGWDYGIGAWKDYNAWYNGADGGNGGNGGNGGISLGIDPSLKNNPYIIFTKSVMGDGGNGGAGGKGGNGHGVSGGFFGAYPVDFYGGNGGNGGNAGFGNTNGTPGSGGQIGSASGNAHVPGTPPKPGKTGLCGSVGLEFKLSDDETAYILNGIGSCNDLEIVIPLFYDNLPVTEIAPNAFSYNTNITLVYIPKTTKIVGDSAFCSCSNLASVIGGNSLEYIGSMAFYCCNNLNSINLPDSLTSIGVWAFYCTGITNVSVPEKITIIEYQTFAISNLTNLTFTGTNIKTIGDGAFSDCSGLKNIVLPNGTTKIGSSAFYNCNNLASITIPDSVTEISSGAFHNCTNLKNIYYSGTKEQWGKINKSTSWNKNTGNYVIHCSDGDISKT